MKSKQCPRCKQTYMNGAKHFHKNKLNKDGLSSVCKECKKEENEHYRSFLKPKLEPIECSFYDCNNIFTPTRSFQIYCCTYCRDKANKFKDGKEAFRTKANFKLRFKAKKAKEKANNYHKKWREDDINILKNMKFNGFSYDEIGDKLGRTPLTCSRKWYLLQKVTQTKNI